MEIATARSFILNRGIVTDTMPLLSIKDLAVAISTRAGPAEDDPPLSK